MPNRAAKFSTEYLSEEQMRAALLALPSVLQRLLGKHAVIASYGWQARIHSSLSHVPMHDNTDCIQYLIEDSLEQRIVIPGESDFRFVVPEDRLDVLFCHESDIHLDGSDEQLLHSFRSTFPYLEYRWYSQEDVEKMMK
jgi:hypothetical protein